MAPLTEMPPPPSKTDDRWFVLFVTYRPRNRSGSGLIGGEYAPSAGFGLVHNIFFAIASTIAISFVFSHNGEPARGPSAVQQVFAFTGFLESSLQPGQQAEPQSYRTTP